MKRTAPLIALGVLGLAVPVALWALQEHGAEHLDFARLFWVLAVMLIAGKFSGELSERMGQPAVLGELIAGALLGGSLLGVIPTAAEDSLTPIIEILAEIGVVILLFEIGLETDLKAMFRVGRGAAAIACVGVILPMIGGILFWLSPLGLHQYGPTGVTMTAIFIGGTLTATSVGITARVLQDLRVMHSFESRFIIGAAVIDDVLGLVVLGIVSGLAAGQAVTVLGIGRSFGVAVGFLVVAVGIGLWLAPKIFDVVNRMRVRGMLLVTAFAFVLVIAALADMAGSAMIVGAFAAGLILSGTNQFNLIQERIKPVADIFTPIFFLSIGAEFDVGLLNPMVAENLPVLGLGLSLFVIAVLGKVAAGWAAPWRRFNRLAVGIGMIPRGEVGLIFANIGLATGVLSRPLFGAIIIMVIGTTFIAPPLLKWSFSWGGVTHSFDKGPHKE
ncbi:MAG: cation:proton antiporter [Gemmatimonadota bacterium]|nr:MAG: cation:proton antiporter [Gemmatimonadota bacterium]